MLMAAASGVMATITAAGTSPMALIYQDRPVAEARPTLSALFAIGGLCSVVALWRSGWTGGNDLWIAAWMAPAVVIGTLIGRFHGQAFDRRFRPGLRAIAALAAVVLIARGLA